MRLDSISLVLRPRSRWEGCDLGVRLLQAWMRPVFGTHLAVALPLFALFLLTYTEVWLEGLSVALTLQRLSASRSFKQPILQLEGLTGKALRERIGRLTVRHRGVARATTLVFANAELALLLGIVSLKVWLSPHSSEIPQDWVTAWSEPAPPADDLGRLPRRGRISRALLRRRRLRHVSQSTRRTRGLGHRAGIPSCVRRLTPSSWPPRSPAPRPPVSPPPPRRPGRRFPPPGRT